MMIRMLTLALAALLVTASPAGAQSAPALTTITIATPGQDSNALAYYAQDMGFFAKHGIDAKFVAVNGSGAAIGAAVSAGSVDIGEGGIIDVAQARIHGIGLTLINPSYLYRAAAPATAIQV